MKFRLHYLDSIGSLKLDQWVGSLVDSENIPIRFWSCDRYKAIQIMDRSKEVVITKCQELAGRFDSTAEFMEVTEK